MTDTVRLIIPGPPTPQPRARIVKRGAFATAYDPAAKKKQAFRDAVRRQMHTEGVQFDQGTPISVHMAFYLPLAKSLSKAQKKAKLEGSAPTAKPDADNLSRFSTDCLSGIVYHDDSQIVYLSVSKAYDDEPRTEITINRYSNA